MAMLDGSRTTCSDSLRINAPMRRAAAADPAAEPRNGARINARQIARALMRPYRSVAAHAVPDAMILACQDHGAAAALGWFSCWLPTMAQEADPPAP
ncbi:MAG: hypothetical protein L6R19_26840, partial [Alphaproteobacteria bacterium]|nr:hypothetical protein [Alphaproteobacteria bacterium]